MAQDTPIRIGVSGALGRMGRTVAALVATREDLVLGPLFDQPNLEGQTVDGVRLASRAEALAGSDVIIDFSSAAASVALAAAAAESRGPALVIGSTGFSPEQAHVIEAAAAAVPMVRSGNFSVGVNLLAGMVAQAAARLSPADFDIEVFEAHHRRKVDAPSGTALMLGQAAAKGRGVALADAADRGRDGMSGPRREGAIGFSVMRGGGIVGEHSVIFAGESEIITFSHSARDRGLFARGALAAAVWVNSRPAGLYDMQDVLGLNTPA